MDIIITTPERLMELLNNLIDKKLGGLVLRQPNSVLQQDTLMTFKEVLLLLRISRPTLFKYMREGKVPYKKIGRRLLFKKTEVLLALDNSEKR